MRKATLLSTVAAAGLLLTAVAASAQGMKKDEAPTPAPAAQQSAPAEKVAPNMKAGEKNAETHKPAETTGQAPNASDAGKTRATEKGAMDKSDTKADADVKGKADTKASESTTKDGAAQKSSDSKANPSATTGQGSAAGAAKLSTEQRTKISSVIRQKKVESVHLNVSVSVGTRIPDSVHFYPLPQEVFVIYPEWRGYDYILVGDQIVVVDPRTHEIVAVLDA